MARVDDVRGDARPALKEGDAASTAATSLASLKVLEILANAEHDLGVTHIARLCDMPKARVHRHLSTLRSAGYVTQSPSTHLYGIGANLYVLGRKLVKRFDAVSLAMPHMEALRDRFGLTVVLTTFNDTEVTVLDMAVGQTALNMVLQPGTRFDFHVVAQGKIALAFGPSGLRDRILAGPLIPRTPHTITDPTRLAAEIATVEAQGWAGAVEEGFFGINAFAAPVFNADGGLFGSLALVGSTDALAGAPDAIRIQALTQAASEISRAFGLP